MLVSFLVFGQISYFLYGRILVFILRIFGPIYRHVIPTFFSFDALIKLRVFISLWFLKELIELIGFLWGSTRLINRISIIDYGVLIYQGSCFHISNESRSSIQAEYESSSSKLI